MIGAATVAAVLGAGGIAFAAQHAGETSTGDVGAIREPAPSAGTAALTGAPASPGASTGARGNGSAQPARAETVGASPAPAQTTPSKTPAERAAAAKKAGRQRGVPMMGPLSPPPADPGLDVRASDWIIKNKQRIQVVYARGDLTGQEQLAWVADGGEPFGQASCSQRTQLSNDASPKVRPNLLLCWRTSARKSVYTLTIDLDGHPSKAESVAALNKQWSRMG
jgi:hypothetical protein